MTDIEMLELAAKAAGVDGVRTVPFCGLHVSGSGEWNPLESNADAFRLAVDLGIEVEFISDGSIYASAGVPTTGGDVCEHVYEYSDKHAATRLAIVKAAAEIGSVMR